MTDETSKHSPASLEALRAWRQTPEAARIRDESFIRIESVSIPLPVTLKSEQFDNLMNVSFLAGYKAACK